MFNHGLDYEYDVEAFKSYMDKAKSLANPEEQIELYQKAVELVRGPFLTDIFADWAMFEREHLNQIYLSALLTLANLFQKQALLEKALATCQRAVEYEPAFEEAYCLSMQIYKRLGDRTSIKRVYQTCRDALKRRLDMPPSKETEALYHSLIV
jgi:two-component SAPR family response regulator